MKKRSIVLNASSYFFPHCSVFATFSLCSSCSDPLKYEAVTGTAWADFHLHLSQTLRVYEMSDLGGEPWTMVKKRGNQSVVNDKPFYVNGFNTYWLMVFAVDQSTKGKVSEVF